MGGGIGGGGIGRAGISGGEGDCIVISRCCFELEINLFGEQLGQLGNSKNKRRCSGYCTCNYYHYY